MKGNKSVRFNYRSSIANDKTVGHLVCKPKPKLPLKELRPSGTGRPHHFTIAPLLLTYLPREEPPDECPPEEPPPWDPPPPPPPLEPPPE
jgi:hypothetical protein